MGKLYGAMMPIKETVPSCVKGQSIKEDEKHVSHARAKDGALNTATGWKTCSVKNEWGADKLSKGIGTLQQELYI